MNPSDHTCPVAFRSVEDCLLKDGDALRVVLRLMGGKGGFGSNLREAGKKAGGYVTNFDACRYAGCSVQNPSAHSNPLSRFFQP